MPMRTEDERMALRDVWKAVDRCGLPVTGYKERTMSFVLKAPDGPYTVTVEKGDQR